MGLRISLCVVFAVLLGPRLVRGGEATYIIVLSDSDPLGVRAAAEVSDLGYTPLREPGDQESLDAQGCLDHLEPAGADGLIEIHENVGVTSWAHYRDTHRAVRLEVLPFSPERDAASVLVQAMEALRGRLMQIEQERVTRPAPVDGTQSDGTGDDDRQPRMSLQVGPSLVYGFSDLPPSLQVGLGAKVLLHRRLSFVFLASFPTLAMRYNNDDGELRAWNLAIQAGLRLDLGDPKKAVMPFLCVLGGAHLLFVRGEGNQGHEDGEDRVAASLLSLQGGVEIPLTRRVWVFIAGSVGLGLPRQVVRMGDLIPFGNPFLTATVGVTVALF